MLIKKILPKRLRNLSHLLYAWYGAHKYRHPSEQLYVIGVTGTSGKSTTIFLLRQLLEQAGFRVGSLSTIDFYIAGENKLNDKKMTMLGKMKIQQYLREMVEKKCDIALVETTSEGAVQHRHRFINYDAIVLTNLYPEHIESHGSFEAYKQAKLNIFSYVAGCKRKKPVEKLAVVNGESEYANEFLKFPFDKRLTFGKTQGLDIQATNIHVDKEGLQVTINGHDMHARMFGEHNVMNILAATAIGRHLGMSWEKMQAAITQFGNAPGRNEFIKEAEARGFQVIVDYAFEPKAVAALYGVVALIKPQRIIHVFGSTGGGRDISRRFTVGEFVGQHADICIITDEDPYDDDPMSIINSVASAVAKTGKVEGKNLFRILDRKKAIHYAISLAQKSDLVLVTGKGSEQAMCIADGKKIPWDDRTIVREALNMV